MHFTEATYKLLEYRLPSGNKYVPTVRKHFGLDLFK